MLGDRRRAHARPQAMSRRARRWRSSSAGCATGSRVLGSSSAGAAAVRARRRRRRGRPGLPAALDLQLGRLRRTPRRSTAALDELAEAYERAGVAAWTVWAPEFDRDAIAVLEARGPRSTARRRRCRSSSPASSRPRSATSTGTATPTAAELGRINDLAYGLPGRRRDGAGARRPSRAPDRSTRPASTARPPACSGRSTTTATSAVYFVATHPDHRGHGLASRLITVALAEGRERGPARPRRCRRRRWAARSTCGSATATTSRCNCTSAGDDRYSDEQLEAAVEALTEPGRFEDAEAMVARAAPGLQRILAAGARGRRLVRRAARGGARRRRSRSPIRPSASARMRTLLAEEARMGMMVGVAVGWALAEELKEELRCRSSSSATRRSSSPTATRGSSSTRSWRRTTRRRR